MTRNLHDRTGNQNPTDESVDTSRREFIARSAAAGAGSVLAGAGVSAAARTPAGAPAANAIRPSGFPAPALGSVRDSLAPLAMSSELVVTKPQPVSVLPRDHTGLQAFRLHPRLELVVCHGYSFAETGRRDSAKRRACCKEERLGDGAEPSH